MAQPAFSSIAEPLSGLLCMFNIWYFQQEYFFPIHQQFKVNVPSVHPSYKSIESYGGDRRIPPCEFGHISLSLSLSFSLPRDHCSKAREWDSLTVDQPCIWFLEEPSQFSMGQTAQSLSNLFHHGETTYRVRCMSENPTLVL